MKVEAYTEAHATALRARLEETGMNAPLLRLAPFVRHYFLSHPACKLLLLLDGDGRIAATLGSEHVTLRAGGETFDAAVLSSTYSLTPGAFPLLFMQWMKSAEVGLAFPGNALMTRLFALQKRWTPVAGLRRYWLHWSYPATPQDALWKRVAKPLAGWARRVDASRFARQLRGVAPSGMTLREEHRFDDTMLPTGDTFAFRAAHDAAFLNWRFDTSLDYVRYRVFRIERNLQSCGHVVIAEWPHCLVVSHCDADDTTTLVCAVLLAISRLNQGAHRYRKVLCSSMHPGMQQTLMQFGFAPDPRETPFHVAAFSNRLLRAGTAGDWLVNLDLGDAGTVLGLVYKP